uniref:Protein DETOXIFICATION n=1 Tax=Kalanchoe fedtschenkoi TaxID=63787 RepID=A0A7N0T0M9_KALFE
METAHLGTGGGSGAQSGALIRRVSKQKLVSRNANLIGRPSQLRNSVVFGAGSGLKYRGGRSLLADNVLSVKNRKWDSRYLFPEIRERRRVVSQSSAADCDVESSDVDTYSLERQLASSNLENESSTLDIKRELVMLSLPAMAGQAIEPLAQLMETAYIGRLGPVALGSAGVSISIFNIVSKLFNIPLLSVATSFVAEDIAKNDSKDLTPDGCHFEGSRNGKPARSVVQRKQLSSVSTALLLALGIGVFEAVALYAGSGSFLNLMGIKTASPMRAPAEHFLSLRALGAPAVVVSLALQGVLRGFKDMKTPVLCFGIGNFVAVFLFPLLMYYLELGITGAAMSTVISQYIIMFLLIWQLNKKAVLLPPKLGALAFGGYLKSGGFLIGRTLASLMTMTLGTSMAARQGPVAMAAHQIFLQVWLAVSLLTDALAASGQALIASSYSKEDYKTVKEITLFVLKIGILSGIFLAATLGISFGSIVQLFTKDTEVLGILKTGLLFISASQPMTALAFIFDGLYYGVSDFPYSARSMMMAGVISSAFLLYVPSVVGLPGVWAGLSLFMALRAAAGFYRLQSVSGPWWFLHRDSRAAKQAS